jgi:hypothetical protein
MRSIAGDNESGCLSNRLRKIVPSIISKLAESSVRFGECDDRWQLAAELGEIDGKDGAEILLLAMADEAHEYVRRRALQSLAKIGSR